MKKIGGKLFLGFLCMTALTIGLLWVIQAGILKDSYVNERVQTVQTALQQASGTSTLDFAAMEEDLNAHFLLLDQNGEISYISEGMPMSQMVLRQCRMMLPGSAGTVHRLSSMNGGIQYALIGYPLDSGGTLYAVFSLTDVQKASGLLFKQLWIVTAFLVGFSLLLAVLLSRRFSRPIRNVTLAARELSAGNLDINLATGSDDEIGQLTRALNDLAKQLKITENLRKELIANVSHELRAPLSVIQGYAETVRDVTWPNTEKRTDQLTIIADEAARLSRMVADILDYSKLQAGEEKISVTDFPAVPVIQNIIKLNELEAAAKNIKIELASPDLTVRFDQNRFRQVIMNLLGNAVSYSNHDSKIRITIKKTENAARILIQNEGPDIPKNEIGRIWDRYYRGGDAHTPGTGFGLSIVKSILDVHKTAYGVQSEDGKTVFWFETQAI